MQHKLDVFAMSDALFCEAILDFSNASGGPFVVGLCGAQGSGKSTAAKRMAERLANRGLQCVALSLDDFYLSKADRVELAAKVHRLLVTRGVPGTHDTLLLEQTLDALTVATTNSVTAIPVFDKASDDRLPAGQWHQHLGGCDVILLEGWCVGARPQPDEALAKPVNDLERDEDAAGYWRSFVNRRLGTDYAGVFARLDFKLLLKAPNFAQVLGWRLEQERGLDRSGPGAGPAMSEDALQRFIAHFQRLTEWILIDQRADVVAELDDRRRPISWRVNCGKAV